MINSSRAKSRAFDSRKRNKDLNSCCCLDIT